MTETEKTDTQSPLLLALHVHIQAIAARPIDARMLMELEKTCVLARELIAVGQVPDALRKRNFIPGGPMGMYESGMDSYVSPAMPMFQGVAAGAAPGETFGVQAIRELINLLPTLTPQHPEPTPPQVSFTDLMTAAQLAKNDGETDLYTQLQTAIRVGLEKLPGLPGMLISPPNFETPESLAAEKKGPPFPVTAEPESAVQ